MDIRNILNWQLRFLRAHHLTALLAIVAAGSTSLTAAGAESPAGLAFARYVNSAQTPDAFHESGATVVQIEATVPGLHKQCTLLGVSRITTSGQKEYAWLGILGDSFIAEEAIAPYLAIQDELERMPQSSVAITPANYKFRYVGPVGAGAASAYVFRVTPKRKAAGMIEGQLWIDAKTGVSVLQSGELIKTPRSVEGPVQFVRDIELFEGIPVTRVTHVTLAAKRIGRTELTVTEARLFTPESVPMPAETLKAGSAFPEPGNNQSSTCSPYFKQPALKRVAGFAGQPATSDADSCR